MGNNRIKQFLPKPEVEAEEEKNSIEPLAPDTNPLEWFFKQAMALHSRPSPLRAVEHPDHFEVTLEAPGFSKEELSLTLKGGVLLITGKKTGESTPDSVTELSYTITLGDGLDADNVEASHKDGVLTIKVPKVEDTDAKDIEIK